MMQRGEKGTKDLCRALVHPSTPRVTCLPFNFSHTPSSTFSPRAFISSLREWRCTLDGMQGPKMARNTGSSMRLNARPLVAHNTQQSSFGVREPLTSSASLLRRKNAVTGVLAGKREGNGPPIFLAGVGAHVSAPAPQCYGSFPSGFSWH